jgi:hypothetical protein
MFFADIFGGCFAMCGCNFYRDVPAGQNKVWPGFWRSPEGNLVKLARGRSRFVLLTGTDDFNHESTKAVADAMTAEKFAHVTFLDIPGMEHKIGYVTADWFEKGLAALDEPVFEQAEATYQFGLDQEKKGQRGEAILSLESAARHGKDHAWVKDAKDRAAALRKQFDEQLAIIRKQVDDRKFDEARAALRQFKPQFAPLGNDAVAELTERIRVARGGAKGSATKPSAPVPGGAS